MKPPLKALLLVPTDEMVTVVSSNLPWKIRVTGASDA